MMISMCRPRLTRIACAVILLPSLAWTLAGGSRQRRPARPSRTHSPNLW